MSGRKVGMRLLQRMETVNETFTLTVDYRRSLAEMVSGGKYDWVGWAISEDRFPHQHTGVVELECKIFDLYKGIDTQRRCSHDFVINELEKEGFAPSDAATLCALGEKFPEKQTQFNITAPGQRMRCGFDAWGSFYWSAMLSSECIESKYIKLKPLRLLTTQQRGAQVSPKEEWNLCWTRFLATRKIS